MAAITLRGGSSESDAPPAHLRGAAPLPFAEVISLDLAAGDQQRLASLRTAYRAVTDVGDGGIAAWLGLGESMLSSTVERPRQLRRMPAFAGDVLDPAQSHGDLLVQITGPSPRAVRSSAERILDPLPQWQVRWRISGVRPENRTEDGKGLSLNPFHFTEGHGNPATPAGITERATVTAGQKEPSWAVGGSYQVIRIVRLATASGTGTPSPSRNASSAAAGMSRFSDPFRSCGY
ncbi:Dyp-type peroxidase [Streptomyces sp. NBC_01604]|uniref:Dyp-type peroxidase domain-containing protein n=1 Tax=Streptomyces sp. NBC_01604 TaxID=2975894 RepID=UPI00386772AE